MKTDQSAIWFEKYFREGRKEVIVEMRDGRKLQGHFSGFFYGDADRGEPLIYRWRLNPSSEQEFDYDKTIIPDTGILILQEDILSVIPAQ